MGTPTPLTSNEKVTLPAGTPNASRFALQLHAPSLPGSVALHAVLFADPAQSAEKTTSVKVVTPSPVAVGLADRVVVYEVELHQPWA